MFKFIPVALVATLALSAAACGGGSDGSAKSASNYPAKVRGTFMASCMANGGDSASCACTYETIQATVPYKKFVLGEAVIQQGGSLTSMPSKLAESFTSAVADCRSRS
jgi:hypothetical protein